MDAMETTAIPVINAASLDRADTLRALDCACRSWGAFQVVGHGIEHEVSERLMASMQSFFSRSSAYKRQLNRTESNPWGFFDAELTGNTPDWKEIYDYGPADGGGLQPQWPGDMPDFREAVSGFYTACEGLAFKLLAAISANLGARPGQTSRCFRPSHTSFLRLNYYPPCPNPEITGGGAARLGVNQHTDAGALTLLQQDRQPGLEVCRDGQWYLVEAVPNALVINLGDIVQVWSNDRYRAPLHRVRVNERQPRYSAPFFFNPTYETVYRPLSATVDAQRPGRYRGIRWGEFRQKRAQGDFADYGEEVQISHYRL